MTTNNDLMWCVWTKVDGPDMEPADNCHIIIIISLYHPTAGQRPLPICASSSCPLNLVQAVFPILANHLISPSSSRSSPFSCPVSRLILWWVLLNLSSVILPTYYLKCAMPFEYCTINVVGIQMLGGIHMSNESYSDKMQNYPRKSGRMWLEAYKSKYLSYQWFCIIQSRVSMYRAHIHKSNHWKKNGHLSMVQYTIAYRPSNHPHTLFVKG